MRRSMMSNSFGNNTKCMNKIDLMNEWASQLSIENIRNLSEDELLNFVMERPGHPGQYGFMFSRPRFVSDNNFFITLYELTKRLGKVENLKEKMQILRQK